MLAIFYVNTRLPLKLFYFLHYFSLLDLIWIIWVIVHVFLIIWVFLLNYLHTQLSEFRCVFIYESIHLSKVLLHSLVRVSHLYHVSFLLNSIPVIILLVLLVIVWHPHHPIVSTLHLLSFHIHQVLLFKVFRIVIENNCPSCPRIHIFRVRLLIIVDQWISCSKILLRTCILSMPWMISSKIIKLATLLVIIHFLSIWYNLRSRTVTLSFIHGFLEGHIKISYNPSFFHSLNHALVVIREIS